MKKLPLAVILLISGSAYGQDSRWQISAQVLPELTMYRTHYPEGNAPDKLSFNWGGVASAQYNFNARLFITAGLAYASRTFYTKAMLFQGGLPPDKRSGSGELVTTRSISYRIASVPVGVGYFLGHSRKLRPFITAGLAANYLINARYISNFSRYDGTYEKNEWLGASATIGGGLEYRLTKRLAATSSLNYAFLNPVREDAYLLGQQSLQALTHRFVSIGIGAKLSL